MKRYLLLGLLACGGPPPPDEVDAGVVTRKVEEGKKYVPCGGYSMPVGARCCRPADGLYCPNGGGCMSMLGYDFCLPKI